MVAWVRGLLKTGRAATLYVAANDATFLEKFMADYVCDGTDDHTEIIAAISALPSTGGSVRLSSGTFNIGAAVTYGRANSTLEGGGHNTILKGQSGCGNIWLVAVNNNRCRLRNLKIDGNKAVNGAYTTTTACYITAADPIVENVVVVDSPGYGFFFEVGTTAAMGRNLVSDGCVNVGFYVRAAASPNGNATTLIGCIARNNGSDGFANDSGVARFIGCLAYGNTGNGFGISPADTSVVGCESVANLSRGFGLITGARQTISSSVARLNSGAGIYASGADAVIDGNKVYLNGHHGINTVGASAQITNNSVRENSTAGASTYENIYVQGNYSYINGNTARRGASGNRAGYGLRIGAGVTAAVVGLNDLYDSGMTGDYLDSGTGTRRIRTTDIEDSAITSAKIADGTIATGDIAANAITQLAQKTVVSYNDTTNNASFVTMKGDNAGEDMAVTLTTTGGDILALFSGVILNASANGLNAVGFSLDGADTTDLMAYTAYAANAYGSHTIFYRWAAPSAASHTIRVRWRAASGTAGAYGRQLIVMEVKR